MIIAGGSSIVAPATADVIRSASLLASPGQVANLPNLRILQMSRSCSIRRFSVPERRPSIGCEIQSDCRTEDVWGRAAIQLACPTAKALRSSCGKTSKAFGEALDSWRQWTGMVLRGEPRCSLGAQLLWKWYGSARLSCVHAPNPSLVTTK